MAYTRSMNQIKEHSLDAYKWVEKLAPKTWIKAFFDPFFKCEILLNNRSEVFNMLVSFIVVPFSVTFVVIDCVETFCAATFWMEENCQLNQCWITYSGR